MRVVYGFIAFIAASLALILILSTQVSAAPADNDGFQDMGTVAVYNPPPSKPKVSKPAVSEPPVYEPEHITHHLTKSTAFEIADQLEYVLDSMHITDDDVIEVFDSGLTAQILENRAGKWIIEIVYGTCVSEWGDGETDDGYFITYGGVSGVEIGKRYRTFEVYNPLNNAIDDILERFDFEI